ncbi:YebC/PmpR family DNA-binding transcriptional regulator [Candidatus Gottesmanbacteria bacterium]|nr:YebC/PmpR family DNA-binding transcriptional regulator [Candidatus Gottesmanbacteria bacterium]
MSGHSKWSKVKHQKATTDVAKAAAFTKASRAITVAVKEGGGVTDPNGNFRLRLAMDKAREVNMPKDTIQRAIDKAAGEGATVFEQVLYEGYGPGGAAILIEGATDNRNRTTSIVKNVLERGGGTLAGPGAVQFQFVKNGVLFVHKGGAGLDAMIAAGIEAGAEDVTEAEDVFEVYTEPAALYDVKQKLVALGFSIETAELVMNPVVPLTLTQDQQTQLGAFIDQLELLDDVQKVYTNAVWK